ncbi:MAG: ribonuclease HIII [Methanobacterium sp.]|jgi:ribonuclease HIII
MANISLMINDHEILELKNLINKNKIEKSPVTNDYESLRVKNGKISLILYKTGKIVYTDNESSRKLLNTILERDEVYDYILGSDETGKGEWYGPLVVVATALTPEEIIELRLLGVKDSKTIKKPQIIKLAKKIIEMDFKWQSIILKPRTYNNLYNQFKIEGKSLNDIMAWAHSKVIQQILAVIKYRKAKVIIDKFDYKKTDYRLKSVDQTGLKIIQMTGGESEIPVATASIIAKYLFEKTVDELNDLYNVNFRDVKPENVKSELLSETAKIHFKNVQKLLIKKNNI